MAEVIDSSQPTIYQIRIKSHLSPDWTDWFDGLTITLQEDGDTLLSGPVVDQAALHGLLKKVRDLGLPLISVNCIEPSQADSADNKTKIEARDLKLPSSQQDQVDGPVGQWRSDGSPET